MEISNNEEKNLIKDIISNYKNQCITEQLNKVADLNLLLISTSKGLNYGQRTFFRSDC